MKKSWIKCKCGEKLHSKTGTRQCYRCKKKEIKKNIHV